MCWSCVSALRDPVSAGADRPPCSGRVLRSGSQLSSCVEPLRSTQATSVAGEEGEDEERDFLSSPCRISLETEL